LEKPLGSAEQITLYCSSFDFASEELYGIFGDLLRMKMLGVYRPAAYDEETGEPDAGHSRKGPKALQMSLMPANGQALTYLNSILIAARTTKGIIPGKLVRYGGSYQAECLELSFQVPAATSSKLEKVCVSEQPLHMIMNKSDILKMTSSLSAHGLTQRRSQHQTLSACVKGNRSDTTCCSHSAGHALACQRN